MIEFHLDKRSGIAPYQQLIQQVRHALRLGMLEVGDQLPTIKEVVTSLALNPNTVLKAYKELENFGLVAARPGIGIFVRNTLSDDSLAASAALGGLLARARRLGEGAYAMAQAELRDSEAEARAEAARLAAQWQRSEKQIQRYQQAIVPQTSAAIDAARSSYLSGRGDFLTVVDDFNRWLDARVQLASREAERFSTWAELEALIVSPAGSQSGKEN